MSIWRLPQSYLDDLAKPSYCPDMRAEEAISKIATIQALLTSIAVSEGPGGVEIDDAQANLAAAVRLIKEWQHTYKEFDDRRYGLAA